MTARTRGLKVIQDIELIVNDEDSQGIYKFTAEQKLSVIRRILKLFNAKMDKQERTAVKYPKIKPPYPGEERGGEN